MASRIAAACSLIVFALCLVLGIQAQNTFSTTISRALAAMAGTFVVGLALGAAAQKMLDENIAARGTSSRKPAEQDRTES